MAVWSLLATGCTAAERSVRTDGTGGEPGREHAERFIAAADAFSQGEIQAISLTELPEKRGTEGIVSLGNSPEGMFEMYGYYDSEGRYGGILLLDLWENTAYFPDIAYTSGELVPPRMLWDPEENILLASFRTRTENGESADDLWAFMRWETGHLEAVPFDREECEKRLKERLSYEVNTEENTAAFFDRERLAGTFPLGSLDGRRITDAVYTGRLTFLAEDGSLMELVPGFLAEGTPGIQYLENGSLQARISAERTGESGEETVRFTIFEMENHL